MAVTLLPSKLVYSPSTTMYLSLFSSGTFKLSYAPWHTSQFLSQARATTTDGFLEGQLGADPEFGTCLQCAAIDRARLKTNPVTPRSGICSGCFKKYCYDPQNPPPEGQIVGRRFKFKDPDPFGLKSFYMTHKAHVIIAAIIVGVGLIATITGCVMFWWRRFQRRRAVAYQKLARGDGSEWSPRMARESYDGEPPHYLVLSNEKANRSYSEVGYGVTKTHYAEPSYETAKAHYEEPSYETSELHSAGPSYDIAKTHYAEPSYDTTETHYEERSYETAKRHYAGPSYGAAKTHYAAPDYAPEKTHYAEPSYETVQAHYAEPNYETEETQPTCGSEKRD